jgi:hypothetical protein
LGVSIGRTSMEGATGTVSVAVELAASAFIGELLRVELEKDEVDRDEFDPIPPFTLILLKVVCA